MPPSALWWSRSNAPGFALPVTPPGATKCSDPAPSNAVRRRDGGDWTSRRASYSMDAPASDAASWTSPATSSASAAGLSSLVADARSFSMTSTQSRWPLKAACSLRVQQQRAHQGKFGVDTAVHLQRLRTQCSAESPLLSPTLTSTCSCSSRARNTWTCCIVRHVIALLRDRFSHLNVTLNNRTMYRALPNNIRHVAVCSAFKQQTDNPLHPSHTVSSRQTRH